MIRAVNESTLSHKSCIRVIEISLFFPYALNVYKTYPNNVFKQANWPNSQQAFCFLLLGKIDK
jgi:hypothetical protein